MIAKSYRSKSGVGAHERSHTEAFFRKVKFWDGVAPGTPGMDTTLGLGSGGNKLTADALGGGGSGEGSEAKENSKKFGDAPPVFVMPDGYSYMHVKRNGLIFGCATEKNISPVVVIEVSMATDWKLINYTSVLDPHLILCTSHVNTTNRSYSRKLQRCSKIIVVLSPKNQFGKTSSFSMNFLTSYWIMATHKLHRQKISKPSYTTNPLSCRLLSIRAR